MGVSCNTLNIHTVLVCKYVVAIVMSMDKILTHRFFLMISTETVFFSCWMFAVFFFFSANSAIFHMMFNTWWYFHYLTSHYLHMILTYKFLWFKCTGCFALKCKLVFFAVCHSIILFFNFILLLKPAWYFKTFLKQSIIFCRWSFFFLIWQKITLTQCVK